MSGAGSRQQPGVGDHRSRLSGLWDHYYPCPRLLHRRTKEWVRASASVDAQIGGELMVGWLRHDFPFGRLQTRQITAPTPLPAGTAKITYTSGTTGEPKGVCLSQEGMFWTAQTLARALQNINSQKHLVTLPLSILLENLCGIYIPMLLGAQTVVLPSAQIGFAGSSQFNPSQFFHVLMKWHPQSLVLVPELLRALLHLHQQIPESTQSLRFIAVGGGKISTQLLALAGQSCLPVFEGYGLSECGSVVALNLPDAAKAGSVGKPLPGIKVSVDASQQLYVNSPANALGYLGTEPPSQNVATGDLGKVDEEGFIYLHGRLKNIQINAFGRNFSPEWPEAEAMACSAVRRIVIFGEDCDAMLPWLMSLKVNRNWPVSNFRPSPLACLTMPGSIDCFLLQSCHLPICLPPMGVPGGAPSGTP